MLHKGIMGARMELARQRLHGLRLFRRGWRFTALHLALEIVLQPIQRILIGRRRRGRRTVELFETGANEGFGLGIISHALGSFLCFKSIEMLLTDSHEPRARLGLR